ncbi:MAG TPA: hypothetical protein PKW71_10795, partial [Anaerohalosphaeraceae bacterium]|nr:hypothetical protein [Anaerohalosphaeraceae bacterium]
MRRVSFLSGLKLLFSFLFFAASAGAFAGGTQADYQRAAELRSRLAGKVYRDQIEPNWFADGSMFWYRRQTGPNTHEFVTVDLNNPQRQPAFDHQRLAAALTEQGVKDAAADRLALERLEFNLTDNTLRFQTDGKIWQCRLDTYALQIVSEAPEDSLTPMRQEQASAGST